MLSKTEIKKLQNPLYYQIINEGSEGFTQKINAENIAYLLAPIHELPTNLLEIDTPQGSLLLKLEEHHISVYSYFNTGDLRDNYHYTANFINDRNKDTYVAHVYFTFKTGLIRVDLRSTGGEKILVSENQQNHLIDLAKQHSIVVTPSQQRLDNEIAEVCDKQMTLLIRDDQDTPQQLLAAKAIIQRCETLIQWGVSKRQFKLHDIKSYVYLIENSQNQAACEFEPLQSDLSESDHESEKEKESTMIQWPSLSKYGFYRKKEDRTKKMQDCMQESLNSLRSFRQKGLIEKTTFDRAGYLSALEYFKEASQASLLNWDERQEDKREVARCLEQSKIICKKALVYLFHSSDQHFIHLSNKESYSDLLPGFEYFAPFVSNEALLTSAIKRKAPDKIEWLLEFGKTNLKPFIMNLFKLAVSNQASECFRALLKYGFYEILDHAEDLCWYINTNQKRNNIGQDLKNNTIWQALNKCLEIYLQFNFTLRENSSRNAERNVSNARDCDELIDSFSQMNQILTQGFAQIRQLKELIVNALGGKRFVGNHEDFLSTLLERTKDSVSRLKSDF